MTSALVLGLAVTSVTPAAADPAVGLGLSFSFGGRSGVDTGIGLRVFSNDKQDQAAASVGLDYMFQSQRIRPSVGAAWLGTNTYVGLDLGYDFTSGGFDFGVGAGGVDTKRNAAPVPVMIEETLQPG